MVEHRRTPGNKVSVPAGWFIVLSIVACVGAAGWLGSLLVGPTSASADDTSATATPSPATPAPTTSSPTPTPEPTETTPEPAETAEKEVQRESAVSVLNNTRIPNLARAFSGRVGAAGWTVAGTGNWRGQIVANTVYYPEGLRAQADLLADDVGISRVLPSIVPMQMDRLTIILSGPQQ